MSNIQATTITTVTLTTYFNTLTYANNPNGFCGFWQIAYGNGTFVSCDNNSNFQYSTNPLNGWSGSVLNTNQADEAITYNQEISLFCVVGGWSGNNIAYSSDGQNWNYVTQPQSECWNSVSALGSLFVCAAAYDSNGTHRTEYSILTFDGNTLTSTLYNLPIADYWYTTRATSSLVAIIGETNFAVSPDGINWTVSPLLSNNNGAGYAPFSTNTSLFCAVLNVPNGKCTAISSDGINWTTGTSILTNQVADLKWCGSLWVSTFQNTTNVGLSSDGLNWTIYENLDLSFSSNNMIGSDNLGNIIIGDQRGTGNVSVNAFLVTLVSNTTISVSSEAVFNVPSLAPVSGVSYYIVAG
jgi:hypothetical protein